MYNVLLSLCVQCLGVPVGGRVVVIFLVGSYNEPAFPHVMHFQHFAHHSYDTVVPISGALVVCIFSPCKSTIACMT